MSTENVIINANNEFETVYKIISKWNDDGLDSILKTEYEDLKSKELSYDLIYKLYKTPSDTITVKFLQNWMFIPFSQPVDPNFDKNQMRYLDSEIFDLKRFINIWNLSRQFRQIDIICNDSLFFTYIVEDTIKTQVFRLSNQGNKISFGMRIDWLSRTWNNKWFLEYLQDRKELDVLIANHSLSKQYLYNKNLGLYNVFIIPFRTNRYDFDLQTILINSIDNLEPVILGSFDESFPSLSLVSKNLESLEFGQFKQFITNKVNDAKPSISLFGLSLNVNSVRYTGLIIITCIFFYFWIHLTQAQKLHSANNEKLDIPWIGLYKNNIAQATYLLSLFIPVITTLYTLCNSNNEELIILISITSLLLILFIIYDIYKKRNWIYKAESS